FGVLGRGGVLVLVERVDGLGGGVVGRVGGKAKRGRDRSHESGGSIHCGFLFFGVERLQAQVRGVDQANGDHPRDAQRLGRVVEDGREVLVFAVDHLGLAARRPLGGAPQGAVTDLQRLHPSGGRGFLAVRRAALRCVLPVQR